MDQLSPLYLPPSSYKHNNVNTPEKASSTSRSSKRFSFITHTEPKPSKFMAENSLISQTVTDKTTLQIQESSKKILDKIHEIDDKIEKNKLPFVKYYQPGTEEFKSKKEITKAIHTSYDFFKTDPSFLNRSKYKPKDFYWESPKSKSKTLLLSQHNNIFNDGRTSLHEMNKETGWDQQAKARQPYLRSFYTKGETAQVKISFQEEEEDGKFSPNTSTRLGSLDTSPSIRQLQAGERKNKLAVVEEMVLVKFQNNKIPLNLYNGTVRRKRMIKDLKLGNIKAVEAQDPQKIKTTDIQPKSVGQSIIPENASACSRKSCSEVKNPAEKGAKDQERESRKEIMLTRSPVSNVYYQLYSLTSPEKRTNKTAITLNTFNIKKSQY